MTFLFLGLIFYQEKATVSISTIGRSGDDFYAKIYIQNLDFELAAFELYISCSSDVSIEKIIPATSEKAGFVKIIPGNSPLEKRFGNLKIYHFGFLITKRSEWLQPTDEVLFLCRVNIKKDSKMLSKRSYIELVPFDLQNENNGYFVDEKAQRRFINVNSAKRYIKEINETVKVGDLIDEGLIVEIIGPLAKVQVESTVINFKWVKLPASSLKGQE